MLLGRLIVSNTELNRTRKLQTPTSSYLAAAREPPLFAMHGLARARVHFYMQLDQSKHTPARAAMNSVRHADLDVSWIKASYAYDTDLSSHMPATAAVAGNSTGVINKLYSLL